MEEKQTFWEITYSGKAAKQQRKLPVKISETLKLLEYDLKIYGPSAKGWPHAGSISGKTGVFHCHLNKGHPRYVAIWKVMNYEIQLIEVKYVGSHEGADYRRIN